VMLTIRVTNSINLISASKAIRHILQYFRIPSTFK
jgi:hypothetical protein